ncbi:MAG: hypothetical protein ACTHK7_13085 [Aureliella sp.]
MGFAVGYETTKPVAPELQPEVLQAVAELARGRTWLSCEPPHLIDSGGMLIGASKPNFMPHPDDVASAKREGLPDGTLNDLLDILCELSHRFDVDWQISHDHSDGPLGYIRNGVCDEEVRVQCDAFTELAQELGGEEFDLDNW